MAKIEEPASPRIFISHTWEEKDKALTHVLENALRENPSLLALYRKHTGLYVYRREFLLKFTRFEQTNLEKTEMLEQLRALENGARIKVVEVSESSIGVDTAEDFARVKELIEKLGNRG